MSGWRNLSKTPGGTWVTKNYWATYWLGKDGVWHWAVKDRISTRIIAQGDGKDEEDAMYLAEDVMNDHGYPHLAKLACLELVLITGGLVLFGVVARSVIGWYLG